MSQFTTPAILELLENERFKLAEPFEYHIGALPSIEVVRVPKGYVTDLASIPRAFWWLLPPHGQYAKAAILHDWMYTSGDYTKRFADDTFLEAMTVLKVPTWKREIMFMAVVAFGRGNFIKEG